MVIVIFERYVSFLLHQDENQWPRIQKELIRQNNHRSEFCSENMLVPDVAKALERINFEDEDKSCGNENWMSMPSIGYVLAGLYQRPVFFFLIPGLIPLSLLHALQTTTPPSLSPYWVTIT